MTSPRLIGRIPNHDSETRAPTTSGLGHPASPAGGRLRARDRGGDDARERRPGGSGAAGAGSGQPDRICDRRDKACVSDDLGGGARRSIPRRGLAWSGRVCVGHRRRPGIVEQHVQPRVRSRLRHGSPHRLLSNRRQRRVDAGALTSVSHRQCCAPLRSRDGQLTGLLSERARRCPLHPIRAATRPGAPQRCERDDLSHSRRQQQRQLQGCPHRARREHRRVRRVVGRG